MTIGQAAAKGRGANAFDVLRLVAAVLVLWSHSFILSGNDEPWPHGLHATWGTVGVLMFFSISGFLVTRSWDHDPRLLSFAVKRGVRLLPALVVSLLVTALVIGPALTTLNLQDYLEQGDVKTFILNNATFQSNYRLPGLFAHNPVRDAVNGSLWTLPLELKAYVWVAVLGALGLVARRRAIFVAVALLCAVIGVDEVRQTLPHGERLVGMLADIQAGSLVRMKAAAGQFDAVARHFEAFAVGAALYVLRDRIPLRRRAAAALVVAWAAVWILAGGRWAVEALPWVMPYLVLVAAYRAPRAVRLPRRMGDYSYGIYVYAFVVQQACAQLLDPGSGWLMFAVALPVTTVLAVLSWHLVEAPALLIKQRLAGRPVPDAPAPLVERAELEPVPASAAG